MGEHPRWLAYELPSDRWTTKTGRGQVQRWFVVRLVDVNARIVLEANDPDTGDPEFRAFQWMSLGDLLSQAAPFRQALYEDVAGYTRSLLNADTLRSK